jgi:uncharacterized protein YecE (DUF72 family)
VGRIWFGTSGFSYKEWRPGFYPPDLPDKEFLHYYSTRLNSVEIDYTFYRMPTARQLDAWKNSTGHDFRFAIKASQRITHQERLKIPSDALEYLLRVVPGLDDRLGLMLYQLPPNFRRDDGRLKTFLFALPAGIRCAFEFRHDSWHCPEIYDLLRGHDAALCIHDTDDRTTPLELTAPFTYVRLRRSRYEPARREEWQHRILDWVAQGIEVFAYLKHEAPDAPHLALEFAEGLGARIS